MRTSRPEIRPSEGGGPAFDVLTAISASAVDGATLDRLGRDLGPAKSGLRALLAGA
jgi:hypothetical protein